jgi:hypoxanthine phosphoribosyltransferase
VDALTQDILRQIQRDQWLPDYVVGITRGGLTPAVLISQYLDCSMHALKVSLRENGEDCESNLWMSEDAFGYEEAAKNILIVDDINDSGKTMQWIKQDWQSSCCPTDPRWQSIWNNNVRFAVLTHNTVSEFQDIDYMAQEINKHQDPQWVVYPWEEWWR